MFCSVFVPMAWYRKKPNGIQSVPPSPDATASSHAAVIGRALFFNIFGACRRRTPVPIQRDLTTRLTPRPPRFGLALGACRRHAPKSCPKIDPRSGALWTKFVHETASMTMTKTRGRPRTEPFAASAASAARASLRERRGEMRRPLGERSTANWSWETLFLASFFGARRRPTPRRPEIEIGEGWRSESVSGEARLWVPSRSTTGRSVFAVGMLRDSKKKNGPGRRSSRRCACAQLRRDMPRRLPSHRGRT